jgi:activator of HSP90 ATPase
MFNINTTMISDHPSRNKERPRMPAPTVSRRTMVCALAAMSTGFCPPARASAESSATDGKVSRQDGLTRMSEAIHQEIIFKAARSKVFEALMNSHQFDAITRLSDAATLLTAANAKPTAISQEVGGSFTLFGGYVTGRNVEIVPDERLVQVWRAGSWPQGCHSIVRFVLTANDTETRLALDHRGFPDGQGVHLAPGWHSHYWEPMTKFLALS